MIVAHMHANPGVIRRSCSYTISPPCSHAFDHIVDDVKWQLAANTRILALLQLFSAEISAGSCLIIDIRCSSTRSHFIHSTRASLICFWETSLGFIRCARFAVNTSILGIEVWVLPCTATKIYISRMAYRVEFVAAAWSEEKRDTHLRSNWRDRSIVGAHTGQSVGIPLHPLQLTGGGPMLLGLFSGALPRFSLSMAEQHWIIGGSSWGIQRVQGGVAKSI